MTANWKLCKPECFFHQYIKYYMCQTENDTTAYINLCQFITCLKTCFQDPQEMIGWVGRVWLG